MWLDDSLQTQASEWRSVPLSDGSSMTAAPYTKLRHDMGGEQRIITLVQGSAMFRVAKDPSRPFLVNVGSVVVRATGTQFAVAREGARSRSHAGGQRHRHPAPGAKAKLRVDTAGDGSAADRFRAGEPDVKRVDGERETEYLVGRLTFGAGDTVTNAVAKFNGYNAMQIVVDAATGMRPMRGAFDAIDPLSFADSVKEITGAPVELETNHLVRIGPPHPRNR